MISSVVILEISNDECKWELFSPEIHTIATDYKVTTYPEISRPSKLILYLEVISNREPRQTHFLDNVASRES